MTIALWITLAVIAVVTALTLRLTVALLAPKADNGWDNAIGYALATSLLYLFPARWAAGSGSLILLFLTPILCWTVQTYTLKWIYEVDVGRAWLIGVVHAFLDSAVNMAILTVVGMVVAYFLYGQIIADPIRAILVILKLIGIELPFPLE
ncbi:MAG: hypothetical protein U1E65_09120 [Myxococcota bacterium]